MYLAHFELSQKPFELMPETGCFFGGENRKEILAGLVNAVVEANGVSVVFGEHGSGKTLLCKMLQETLPVKIQPIYLLNSSTSREEMLCAIAAALGLTVDKNRLGLIIRDIQNCLQQNGQNEKRIVVLVDEAHAMPLETLDGLCQLYKLQEGASKRMQIVLFAQPEFNARLNRPELSKIKELILHPFNLPPLSAQTLESYLMFRLNRANYHREALFSYSALKLLSQAAKGLLHRINTLADKSLMAAFIENVHHIEVRHVAAAMRDNGIALPRALPDKKWLMAGGGIAVALLLVTSSWWNLDATTSERTETPAELTPPPDAPIAVPQTQATSENNAIATQAPTPILAKPHQNLYEQRLATSNTLFAGNKPAASIQLFYSKGEASAKLDDFLRNAEKIGQLNQIYLLHSNDGIRVLFGNYPSADAARDALKNLPASYQENFAASIYSF